VVGDGVGAGEGLSQDAGHVVVALVAQDADVGAAQIDAGGVAVSSAIAQRAAVDGEAGGVAPGFAVAQDAAEAGGIEAGGVIVGFVVEELAIFPELEAHAAVAIGEIVMEEAIPGGGG